MNKKYPAWHNEEDWQNMKDALTEQAYNNILEDPDRIEKYIEENADAIQFIIHDCGGYRKDLVTEEEFKEMCFRIGASILHNVKLGIENMAEEDAEEQLS